MAADTAPPAATGEPSTGVIYDIERFALNDGPGIRTLVFLKGCPLHCLWCSSPHTRRAVPELLYEQGRCEESGRCVEVCPREAISLGASGGIVIDRELCDGCGDCVEACPSGALELAGRVVTPAQLVEEVVRDSAFYRRSGGGVTVGGGEPTAQSEFVAEFLRLCRRRFLHTAMETCGYVDWARLEPLLELLDLVYVDLKHMDSAAHQRLTGVPNELILDNLRRAAQQCAVVVRIPIVPGCNDDDENISATARFAASLGDGLERIELLPYHRLGVDVYRRIGQRYRLDHVEPPGDRRLGEIRALVESCGVPVRIGG